MNKSGVGCLRADSCPIARAFSERLAESLAASGTGRKRHGGAARFDRVALFVGQFDVSALGATAGRGLTGRDHRSRLYGATFWAVGRHVFSRERT